METSVDQWAMTIEAVGRIVGSSKGRMACEWMGSPGESAMGSAKEKELESLSQVEWSGGVEDSLVCIWKQRYTQSLKTFACRCVCVPLASCAPTASSLLFIETCRKYVHNVLRGTTGYQVKYPLCLLEGAYTVEWGNSDH